MPKSHSHAHDLGRTGSYSDSAPAGYEQIQNSSPPQGNKKSGSRSKKTKQWIKHKIKGGTDGETPRTYLQEESRSPPVDQSRNGRRSQPPQRGPRYDEQGNYTGDAYIYSTKTRQLERQATNHHGSDSAQAGTSWIEEGESREETESNAVVRRPLSTSAGVPHTTMQSIVERPSDSDRLRQLSHIETWVFGAVKKNSELAGPENESAEDVIIRIVDSYERLYSTTRNAQVQPNDSAGASRMNMVKARDEVRAGNTTLLDENKKLKEDLGRMQNSNTRLENSRNGLLEKTMRMDREYKELKQKFEQESEMLNGQISTLNFQKRELVTSQVEKLRQVQNSQGREIDNLKRGYEERLGQLQGEYDKSIIGWNQSHKALDDLQADFNNRVRSVKADADDKMKEFEGNCERKMQNERNNYEDKIQSLESKIEQLNASLQKVITHKEQELLSQKQELIEMHEDEKKGLRTVIEDFKVATSRREHFKGLTDSEVAGLFTRLVTKIEDFSRLEWDYSKEHEWPLSETRMRQLSNSRKLKQKIVQNTLWIVLYQCFFLSPFRVLGAEGRELDAQWTTIYASGSASFGWPEVSADEERARFETAKAFLAAVGPSAGESASKRGFESSIKDAIIATCRALVKVARVQEDHRKSLDAILRLAGKTWLECCCQRYRLLVVFPEGNSDVLSSDSVDDTPIKLVIRPDLKRYGDSQGRNLIRGEPLAGWKGLTEVYMQ